MIFCRYCGKQIHESAPSCPQCGGVLHPQLAASTADGGQIWLGITSLILGIICTLILFDDKPMDKDTTIGFVMFAAVAIVTGSVAIKNHFAGRKMAIAGIVLSSISLLAMIGMRT